MMQLMRLMCGLLFAALVTACGGGGGSAGTVSVPVTPGAADPATSKVADFVMLMDKSSLPNTGTATAKLSIVAVDAANNIVPGATVTVSTNANTIFTPGSTTTDATGQFTGTVGSGSDKSDRTVTVTAKINGITRQTSLDIIGSKITLTATPAVLNPGAPATITARLTDSSSLPISGKALTFSGDFSVLTGGQATQRTTDSNGAVNVSFTAPGTPGSFIVGVAGSGVSTQMSVQVGSTVVIPPAVIPAGAQAALAALPNVVAPNLAGSTGSQSQLRFLLLDAQNQPVPNVRVRYEITTLGQGSFDSTISTGATTVFTNSSGVATAAFIPGATGSPTDGVGVRACYQATDFTSASQCDNSVSARLTVAAQALAVSIGDNNKLATGAGGITYIKQFAVTVADSAGRPVANAPVDVSVDITHYGKGLFEQGVTLPLDNASFSTYIPSISASPGTNTAGFRVSCINEDLNRNGFVDAGENVNNSTDSFGQPTLEPRKSDILISYDSPDVKTTDANGVLLIKVEYAQRFATWEAYRIRASTTVSGSQGNAERAFITEFLEADLPNGSFRVPPYGTGACNQPN